MKWEKLNGICGKCTHKRTCKKPCVFVERLISNNKHSLYEKNVRDVLTILYPETKKVSRDSELEKFKDGSLETTGHFSTDNPLLENEEFTPKLKQTGIFIDKFFYRKDNKELAEKYNTTANNVAAMYQNAMRRIVKSVEAMDRMELAKNNGTKKLVDMPNSVRTFFLYTLLGLSVSEISKFLGIHHTSVIGQIKWTRDKIESGEIDLLVS